MNFFLCLIRLSGDPVTLRDRQPFIDNLASRGIGGATSWDEAGGIAVRAQRACETGPQYVRDGETICVGDARLDNAADIIKHYGDSCDPASHLALAVRATRSEAPESASRLQGDFAFVAWCSRERRLVAIRDAFGVRSLFYSKLGSGLLAFSSHASLLALNGALDEKFIAKFFVRTISDEDTIFSGVHVIPAAHVFRVTDGHWELQRYWSAERFEINPKLSKASACEEFQDLFAQSVRHRVPVTEPVWSELSGGLDTSAIVSTATWLQRAGATTQGLSGTVTYADSFGSGDESEFVEVVTKHTGVRNAAIHDSWPWRDDSRGPVRTERPGPGTLFWFRDGQRGELLREASAKVLLSGLGGDHLFEGNLSFFADSLAIGAVRGTLGQMARWAALQQRSFWKFAFSHGLLPLLPRAHAQSISREHHLRIPDWVTNAFRKRFDLDSYLKRTTRSKPLSGLFPRYRAGNIEHIDFLASSVPRDNPLTTFERRFPFLHRPLVEFALQLQPELKVGPFMSKITLREAMRGIVPEPVRTRLGKGGVNTRMLWALNHEHRTIEKMLRDPIVAQLGYVDAERLRSAYAAARSGKQHLTVTLYNTLALETWILIETGRWCRFEGDSCVTYDESKKEKSHETIQQAVSEACAR